MNLPEYEHALKVYLAECLKQVPNYDVQSAARELYEKYPDINNIDQVDDISDLVFILMKYYFLAL